MSYFMKNMMLLLMLTSQQAISEEIASSGCFDESIVQMDLIELYTKLKASHYDLYVNVTPAQYDQWLSQTQQEIKPCTSISEVTLLFQKFVAKGKIAHARIELPTHLYVEYQSEGGRFFPLYVRSDGKYMWVSENYSNNQTIKTGDKVISVNGIKTSDLLSKLGAYLSADTNQMLGGFMEFYLGMLLWFEYGEQATFEVTLQREGEAFKTTVKAINTTERKARSGSQPESLELDWQRIAEIKPGQIAYLRPGPFFNTEGQADEVWDHSLFKKFIAESFERFEQQQAKALLIDLRNNPGGDNSFSDLMVKRFATEPFKFAAEFKVKASEAFRASNEQRLAAMPKNQVKEDSTSVQYSKAYAKLEDGDIFAHHLPLNQPHLKPFTAPVYILVNRHSYSNAVTVAAMAQDYGFAKIMGEETSDLATTYGAMEHFELSGTKIKVGFPKAFITRPSGDKTIRGVVPDIKITTPVFVSTADPVFQQALEIINAKLPENK